MPLEYKIHHAENYVAIRAWGDVSPTDWQALIRSLFADKGVYGGRNFLIDVAEQRSVISTDLVWAIIDKVPNNKTRSRWAIVVSRAVSVGVANMFSSLLDGKNIAVQPFEDRAKAMQWLAGPA